MLLLFFLRGGRHRRDAYDILTEKGLSLIRFSIISHTLLIEIARMMGTVNAYIENR